MQFHHHGYVSGDPRVQPAAGTGVDRPAELPEAVDVLTYSMGGLVGLELARRHPARVRRVVVAGLGILATEFRWAHRVNAFAKRHYGRWVRWLGHQRLATKLAVMGATGLVVVATLWLLGLFGIVGSWFDLRWKWLASPLFGP